MGRRPRRRSQRRPRIKNGDNTIQPPVAQTPTPTPATYYTENCDRLLRSQLVFMPNAYNADRMNEVIQEIQTLVGNCIAELWNPVVDDATATIATGCHGSASLPPYTNPPVAGIGNLTVPEGLYTGADPAKDTVRDTSGRDPDNNILVYWSDTPGQTPADGAKCWLYISHLNSWDRNFATDSTYTASSPAAYPTTTPYPTPAPVSPRVINLLQPEESGPLQARMSEEEHNCVGNRYEELARTLTDGTEPYSKEQARLIGCLGEDTLNGIFLGVILTNPPSPETSSCLQEAFEAITYKKVLTDLMDGNLENSMSGTTAIMIATVACLNDDEWETSYLNEPADPTWGKEAKCLMSLTGGPAELVYGLTMSKKEAFIKLSAASKECGDTFAPLIPKHWPTPPPEPTTPRPRSTSTPAPMQTPTPNVTALSGST